MATLIDRFKSIFTTKNQQTNQSFNRAIYNFLGNTLISSQDNDETYVNKGYRFNSTVYSIINLITKAATTVPYIIYEVKNENSLKKYKAITSSGFDSNTILKSNILQKDALIEIDNSELNDILKRPNPAQSFAQFISEVIAFGKLTGNRYIYGISPNTGANASKFTELYVLPSQSVEINSGGFMKPVDYYTLQYNGSIKIPSENVLHIGDFNPNFDGTASHLYGMSPLRAGLRSLDANNEALTTGVKYLQNQTARGVLMSEEGDLNEIQARQLKEKFRQQYQGSNNAGDVIITPKKLSWVNFGMSASDLSLIEQYNASIKDLCNIYNVPAILLNNVESATYNNIKEARKMMYTNAVIPELIKVRDELNRWLVPKFGDNLFLDFDFTVIPELQEETDKIVTNLSQSWWLTPNEKRVASGYGVDEDNDALDDYYFPANLLPVGDSDMPDMTPQPIEVDEKSITKDKIMAFLDAYTTREEAEDRARDMGWNGEGVGFHTHTYDGNEIFMPFETHDEYVAAQQGKLDEFYGMIDADSYYDDDEDTESVSMDDILRKKTPEISGRQETALRNKVKDHNEDVGDNPSKRATYSMLARSYVRGIGAYRTNPSSVRPNVRSEEQWAMGRVNGLLYALRNGRFKRKPYDTDLLPEGHRLSTKKNQKQMFDDYPMTATNNARRVRDWIEKYGRDEVSGGTSVGLARMNQLANREPISMDILVRTRSFLTRSMAGGYHKIDPDFKDTPWKDKGYTSHLMWGGEAMLRYANKKLD